MHQTDALHASSPCTPWLLRTGCEDLCLALDAAAPRTLPASAWLMRPVKHAEAAAAVPCEKTEFHQGLDRHTRHACNYEQIFHMYTVFSIHLTSAARSLADGQLIS
jgi:hypothetical protein